MGTMAFYGPDDKTTTKIAAGVFKGPNSKAIIKRWVATDVTTNPKIQREIQEFFKEHGVTSVSMSDGNMGCPHEEGEDFPMGEDCPFCPFWAGKQGEQSVVLMPGSDSMAAPQETTQAGEGRQGEETTCGAPARMTVKGEISKRHGDLTNWSFSEHPVIATAVSKKTTGTWARLKSEIYDLFMLLSSV